jgi:hypothetical protein
MLENNLINKKVNYFLNDYLSDFDLINKYVLINLKEKPVLNALKFELSIKEVLNTIENINKKESHSDPQIKTFFILYILTSYIPFIHCYNNIKKIFNLNESNNLKH